MTAVTAVTAVTAQGAGRHTLRIVGVGDTDSYVKWGAALLGCAPAQWSSRFVVLETPLAVSAEQQGAALAGSGLPALAVSRLTLDEFQEQLTADPPDAVLVAARGPLARVIARLVAHIEPRPVIVTGLPGISIPATRKALLFRAQCDLFVLHSHREIASFTHVATSQRFEPRFALASLPFAVRARVDDTTSSRGTDLVFAAQAIVPLEREDRLEVAALLIRAAKANPARRVVLKLRAAQGEHQTHSESMPLTDLIDELGGPPENLVTSTEPMRRALATAEGLVTISSTSAIEAIALGVPVIALDSFGVAPELINEVFEESGLYGSDDDVVHRRFHQPNKLWTRENYLHDARDDDWGIRVLELVALRHQGVLEPRAPLRRRGGVIRDAWERKLALGRFDKSVAGSLAMVIGVPLRAVVRAGQRARRAMAPPVSAESQNCETPDAKSRPSAASR
ncbi:DUF6716 putative glycosyltransferase [Microbacterium sp. NPDC076911]|uniref:DUF6716 putative glycosyltransferase n=1 Tax=Microbacterium sp. NPDC076911 TaxID=3154958 RepID=UPI0034343046